MYHNYISYIILIMDRVYVDISNELGYSEHRDVRLPRRNRMTPIHDRVYC